MKHSACSCVACQCGNIECKNIQLKKRQELFISQQTVEKLRQFKKLNFSPISPKSFIIHNQNAIKTHQCGVKAFGIECTICKEIFYFFTSHSTFSIGFSNDCRSSSNDDDNQNSKESSELPIPQIPIILRPFIFIHSSNQKIAPNLSNASDEFELDPIELDEDYMFSPTKIECIVGSYEDRPMLLGSDAIPFY